MHCRTLVLCALGAMTAVIPSNAAMEISANLGELVYYSVNMVYKDLFRQAKYWSVLKPGDPQNYPRDGYDEPLQFDNHFEADTNGYPLEVVDDGYRPVTAVMGRYHQKFIDFDRDGAKDGYPYGTFTLLFEGTGEIRLFAGTEHTQEYTPITGNGGLTRHELTVTPGNEVQLVFILIQRSQRGDHIRNIRLIRPDATGGTSYVNDYTAQPFNPDFVRDLRPYMTIRCMKWSRVWPKASSSTNYMVDHERTWENRPRPTMCRAAHPDLEVPWEWHIDLANALRKNIWITVWHKTSYQYNRNLAQLLKDRLDPSLKCYVEYSNETWAGQFIPYHYVNDIVRDSVGLPNAAYATVYKACRLFKAFDDVFGANSDRVAKVLCSWKGNDWWSGQMLQALGDNKANPDNVSVDGLAVSAYFAGGTDILSVDDMLAVIPAEAAEIKAHHDRLKESGLSLRFLSYEGGHHCEINCAGIARTPAVYDAYTRWLGAIEPYMDMYQQFTAVSHANADGHWGAQEFNGQPLDMAHKYRAICDYAEAAGQFDPGQLQPPPLDGSSWGGDSYYGGMENVAVGATPAGALPRVSAQPYLRVMVGGGRAQRLGAVGRAVFYDCRGRVILTSVGGRALRGTVEPAALSIVIVQQTLGQGTHR